MLGLFSVFYQTSIVMGRKKKEDLNKPTPKGAFEIKVNEFGSVTSSFSIDKLNNLLNEKTRQEAEKNKTTQADESEELGGQNKEKNKDKDAA